MVLEQEWQRSYYFQEQGISRIEIINVYFKNERVADWYERVSSGHVTLDKEEHNHHHYLPVTPVRENNNLSESKREEVEEKGFLEEVIRE